MDANDDEVGQCCPDCGKEFPSQKAMLTHYYTVHMADKTSGTHTEALKQENVQPKSFGTDNCARCGKALSWGEKHNGFGSQLDKGYVDFLGIKKQCPQYKGKRLCPNCMFEFTNDETVSTIGNGEVNSAILWQKNETFVAKSECKTFEQTQDSITFGNVTYGLGNCFFGYLVVTNQRLLYAYNFSGPDRVNLREQENYSISFGVNLEDIVSVSHNLVNSSWKRVEDNLLVLYGNNHKTAFSNRNLSSVIPLINSAITRRKMELSTQNEEKQTKVVLDFSSLKEVMSNGGIVMTTCKCPNCNSMVDIPEAGKILICKYCGTPIKPVDIFEKIRSLIS